MNDRCDTLDHFLIDFNRRAFRRSALINPLFGCSVELGVCNGVNGTPLASLHTQHERQRELVH